ALARGERREAAELTNEYEVVTRGDPNRYLALPEMMRLCRATGERALAARLLQGTDSPVPSHQNAAASARAEFAEIEGDLEEASRLHAEAADRWGGFGFVYERAHSLLGAGRALTLLV